MEIEYWIKPHEHPLRLREDATNNDQFTCQRCSLSVSGSPFYSCDSCNEFYVHKSCAKLPDEIRHPFHPHSLLTLHRRMSNRWDTCFCHSEYAPFYSCDSCQNFIMDEKCAFMPLVTSGSEGQDWIQHFFHPHPLLLFDDRLIKCFVCKKSSLISYFSGGGHLLDLYGCSECRYFLHKSCAQWPKEIHLPLHRDHRYSLVLEVKTDFDCGMCKTSTEGRYNLAYSCKECSLSVCLKCAEVAWTSSGNFKYEDHDHLLCLVKNIKETALLSRCDGYDSYCMQHVVTSSDEFKRTSSSMLWCYQCGFRVHFLCGPLPSAIKHEFHIHPLILVDSMREDDSGEYYCDVCETQRDPLICLYCCKECKYFAHIHCVISEIMKILGGDLRDVELKTVGHDLWNLSDMKLKMEYVDPGMTLKDVINKLSEDEEEEDILRSHYKWDEASSEDRGNVESNNSFQVEDDEIDEILRFSHFTVEDSRRFSSYRHPYFDEIVELKSSDLASKIVKVRDCMIPQSLAPVLNSLFHRFGDIVRRRVWSLWFKSFVLFIICKVVKRMNTTMPICITKNLLQEWYFHLEFSRRCGFRVDFARAQLEQLSHAFFGFQAERLEEEIPAILSRKIDELRRKSNELQRKLDECKEYRDSSPKSDYMEFCLKKASEFKWKMNAFGGDSLARDIYCFRPYYYY